MTNVSQTQTRPAFRNFSEDNLSAAKGGSGSAATEPLTLAGRNVEKFQAPTHRTMRSGDVGTTPVDRVAGAGGVCSRCVVDGWLLGCSR